MKIKIVETKVVEVKYLQVSVGVRYWEDAEVDGVEDAEGKLIPCRVKDNWEPLIELETGKIINWKSSVTAKIHYKVCDDGEYALIDTHTKHVKKIQGYVPAIMCPEGGGYGDYIIMNIDENGLIDNWNLEDDLSEFTETQEE